jgi:hypothetical protein
MERSAVLEAYAKDPIGAAREVEQQIRWMSEKEMEGWLASLSDADVAIIHASRFLPSYLNLAALLHNEFSRDDVRKLAADCTRQAVWYNKALHRWLACLPEGVTSYELCLGRLEGLDTSYLAKLSSERGLITCTFRLGLSSFLPLQIAANGFPVVWLNKHGIFEEVAIEMQGLEKRMEDYLDSDSDYLRNIKLMRLMPVESVGTPLKLARALSQHEIVVLNIDGNTGSDGPWGDESRVVVTFFDKPISVKTGIARLALHSGAPILPIITPITEGRRGQIICSDVIYPPSHRTDAGDERFIEMVMQELYSVLERNARKYLSQWPGVATVHRWRRTKDVAEHNPYAANFSEGGNQGLQRFFEANGALMFNWTRPVVRLSGVDQRSALVDVETLQCFTTPDWAELLLSMLDGPNGLTRRDLAASAPEYAIEERVFDLLGKLFNRGLIAYSPSSAESAYQ